MAIANLAEGVVAEQIPGRIAVATDSGIEKGARRQNGGIAIDGRLRLLTNCGRARNELPEGPHIIAFIDNHPARLAKKVLPGLEACQSLARNCFKQE